MQEIVTPEAHHFQSIWKLKDNPFVFYSAENLEESAVLDLFVADPESSLGAFSYNVNNIIRGKYGCGKTMCLRAVEAFCFSQAIVDLIQVGHTPVIPVKVNLSEIATISEPEEIYKAIILRVFKSLIDAGRKIEHYVRNPGWFSAFREWRDKLTRQGLFAQDIRYTQLSASSVSQQAEKSFRLGASTPGGGFLQAILDLSKSYTETVVTQPRVSIVEINEFHEKYLKKYCDRVLLLFDEVGSLNPSFFVTKGNAPSQYENLLNQLRTSHHIFYKLCVYPGHYSDAIQESRYGVRINLDYSITDFQSFAKYLGLCESIMNKYVRASQYPGDKRKLEDIIEIANVVDNKVGKSTSFSCVKGNGNALEQLCFGSGGIVRRLFSLSAKAMMISSRQERNSPKVDRISVYRALEEYGRELLNRHSTIERNHLVPLLDTCRKEETYRFYAELDASSILKPFLSKTQQDSILYISEHENSSHPAVYEFDYGFCVSQNLPTHSHNLGNKTCEARTLDHSKWISKVADVTDTILSLSGMSRGVILKYFSEKRFGFIKCDPEQPDVFFHVNDIMDFGPFSEDTLKEGIRARFAIGEGAKGTKARSIVLEEQKKN
ncbi:MAG: cold shock domain-containing protein [Proteobacteria bacterium]|jgi:cold shock CspA family protein|nr:cold shock domain-containing protein [Pseudomonadota bacterium]